MCQRELIIDIIGQDGFHREQALFRDAALAKQFDDTPQQYAGLLKYAEFYAADRREYIEAARRGEFAGYGITEDDVFDEELWRQRELVIDIIGKAGFYRDKAFFHNAELAKELGGSQRNYENLLRYAELVAKHRREYIEATRCGEFVKYGVTEADIVE